MENRVSKSELCKRIAELSPEGQKEVLSYIRYLIWRRQKEFLERIPAAVLAEELASREARGGNAR